MVRICGWRASDLPEVCNSSAGRRGAPELLNETQGSSAGRRRGHVLPVRGRRRRRARRNSGGSKKASLAWHRRHERTHKNLFKLYEHVCVCVCVQRVRDQGQSLVQPRARTRMCVMHIRTRGNEEELEDRIDSMEKAAARFTWCAPFTRSEHGRLASFEEPRRLWRSRL